jgi:hypothetical protein
MNNHTKIINHRKKILILPRFQLKLVLFNFIVLIVIFIIFSLLSYNSFTELKEAGLSLNLSETHVYFELLEAGKNVLLLYLLSGLFITLVFTTIFSLWTSQKMAGPVYRLKSHFNLIVETNSFKKIHFREGDYLKEVEDSLNFVIEKASNK